MSIAIPMKRELVEHRVKGNRSADEALTALVLAGCNRETLLVLLGGGIPSLRSWTQRNNQIMPTPKRLRAMAEKLERTSNEIAGIADFMRYLPAPRLRSLTLPVAREVRNLSITIRILAGHSSLRTLRNWLSYRNMGRTFQVAALCRYVKIRTRKSHFREIADLLSAVRQKPVAEDALRHQVERAMKKLEYDMRFPPMLGAFLIFIETVEMRFRGHERVNKKLR